MQSPEAYCRSAGADHHWRDQAHRVVTEAGALHGCPLLRGSIAVIFSNTHNIVPRLSLSSRRVYRNSSGGGFLGAGFAFAFNNGVNRIILKRGGTRIRSYRPRRRQAHEPVSEGMVAILEPFIDTIIICFLTGMVLLSSGVWNEKLPNRFQLTDIEVLASYYSEEDTRGQAALMNHLNNKGKVPLFTGSLNVEEGTIQDNLSLIHARSLAEEVEVSLDGQPFTGQIMVVNGKIADRSPQPVLTGRSLVHSAPLSTAAFSRSVMGSAGEYIVAIALLLFAFSTAIAWSYYGDRSITYLVGSRYVIYYRIIFVIGFS